MIYWGCGWQHIANKVCGQSLAWLDLRGCTGVAWVVTDFGAGAFFWTAGMAGTAGACFIWVASVAGAGDVCC